MMNAANSMIASPMLLTNDELDVIGGAHGKIGDIAGGASAGATVGSLGGPVGTVIGAAVGGFLGWLFG